VNFKIYTRTRSLKNFTDRSKDIYEAVEHLILNEWKSCNEKLMLRLIGVRVSDLKDKPIENKNLNPTIDRKNNLEFFKRNINYNLEFLENLDVSSKKFKLIKCPHCDEIIEGNKEYINQHLDLCINFLNHVQ
jgi:hypothetical protein